MVCVLFRKPNDVLAVFTKYLLRTVVGEYHLLMCNDTIIHLSVLVYVPLLSLLSLCLVPDYRSAHDRRPQTEESGMMHLPVEKKTVCDLHPHAS